MIYWFTGQPGAGKTVLANKLKEVLEKPRNFAYKIFRIDGDEMLDLFSNKDYSIKGRIANIDAAQKIAHYLHNQELDVIVSLVSPYLDQREEFKKILGDQLIEFYSEKISKEKIISYKESNIENTLVREAYNID